MKIILDKNLFLEKLSLASRFTSQRMTTSQILQGILIKGDKKEINFYSSNLTQYFHTKIKKETEKEFLFLLEPQKVIEFLTFFSTGEVTIEIKENKIIISQGKTVGTFPLLSPADFPLPPEIKKIEQNLKTAEFFKCLSLVIFSAAKDEGRPVLTGIDFISNDELTMVATDGFRLSLIKTKKQVDHPPLIIPASFLEEILKIAGKEEELGFQFIQDEKMVVFAFGQNKIYSRLIEGEFPPFEKVIPEKKETRVTLEKSELLRAIKLISIFAREQSNIVVFDFKKDRLFIRPKTELKENLTEIEIKTEGEEQTVAFNYRFLIDFLNHVPEDQKNITIDVLRPDAPVVFRIKDKPNFLHIIMPVRIQE
jgi:DNA polymerase-3 subunit beta